MFFRRVAGGIIPIKKVLLWFFLLSRSKERILYSFDPCLFDPCPFDPCPFDLCRLNPFKPCLLVFSEHSLVYLVYKRVLKKIKNIVVIAVKIY